MFDKDLYEILGVSKTATDKEIRKAFLKLAKKHHPDVNQNNKESEQKFKEVNLAYEVLKDAKKRQQYDQMRASGQNPFAGAQGGAGGAQGQWYGADAQGQGMRDDMFADLGFGDLFREIFGGGFAGGFPGGQRAQPEWDFRRPDMGGSQSRRGGFEAPGQDTEAALTVTFLEAANGGEKSIELSNGKRFTVKIPKGVDSGTKIKLKGQGDHGGDLILVLQVQPHAVFAREGNDILVRLPITFSEAVLGGEVSVPTIDGSVNMKIPKGVSSGQRLKLTGKGITFPKSDRRGDQFVELLIKVPKQPGPEYVEAAEKLKADTFRARD